MSLIFKALQRFEHSESTKGKRTPDSSPKHNALSLRKALFSSPLLIGAGVTIFLVGFALSHFIGLFSNNIAPLTPSVEAAMPVNVPPMETPGNPSGAQSADVELEVTLPSSHETSRAPTFEFHPPGKDAPLTADRDASSGVFEPNLADANGETVEGADSLPTAMQKPTVAVASNSEVKASNQPSQTDNKLPDKVLSLVRYDTAALADPSEDNMETTETPASTRIRQRSIPEINPAHERTAAQATRHLKISKLTKRIYGAIHAGDVGLSNKLLSKVSRMKGKEHPFVLKLKAYSLIRQNRLEEAQSLLFSVLANSADDLDAGLNMAVIDMKSGRIENARRRLVHLRSLFPENSHITQYLRQLPSS